jgi:hypothetical protein
MERNMNEWDWTISDLAGELLARGIDINDVPDALIEQTLWVSNPSKAAKEIADQLY